MKKSLAHRRRVVPDASVMVAAFFRETIRYQGNEFDISRRANELAAAIMNAEVMAIAPDHLLYEFLKCAHRKVREDGLSTEEASKQVEHFLRLWTHRVRVQPMGPIATRAWSLSIHSSMPPPDSWYLACAMNHNAELWISTRDQKDHFADHAQAMHKQVYVLTECRFRDH